MKHYICFYSFYISLYEQLKKKKNYIFGIYLFVFIIIYHILFYIEIMLIAYALLGKKNKTVLQHSG